MQAIWRLASSSKVLARMATPPLLAILVMIGITANAQAASTVTISGTVTAQSTGVGVSGAEVTITEAGTSNLVAIPVDTASDGSYSVSVPSGRYDIMFTPSSSSGLSSFADRDVTVDQNTTINATLASSGSVTLSGVLKDSSGDPIRGAVLILSGSSVSEQAETSRQGEFSMTLPEGAYKWTLNIPNRDKSQYIPEGGCEFYGSTTLSSSVKGEFIIPTHTVAFRTVGPENEPVPETLVVTESEKVRGQIAASVDLAPGFTVEEASFPKSGVATGPEGYGKIPWTDWNSLVAFYVRPPTRSELAYTTFTQPGITKNQVSEIKISPGVKLSGIVKQPTGDPIGEATLRLFGSSGRQEVITNAEGKFSIALSPGTYEWSLDRADGYDFVGTITLSSSVDEELVLPTHTLTVRTLGHEGDPIPGTTIKTATEHSQLAPGTALSPNFIAQNASYQADATTNSEGYAQLIWTNWSEPSTIYAYPPEDTQLTSTSFSQPGIIANQTHTTVFGESPTDTTPPEVGCATPSPGWHPENVNIACTASDSGSGLADPEDVSFTLSTNIAAGEETANAYTNTRKVCDKADNCTQAGPIGPIEIDRKTPQYGRCVRAPSKKMGGKTVYSGGFTTAICLEESATHTGDYEWEPGVSLTHFTTKLTGSTTVALETVKGDAIICKGETGGGEYTGLQTVGNVVLTFTGCEQVSTHVECASSGAAAGEVITDPLDGSLGVYVEGVTPVSNRVGLDLSPASQSGPFMAFDCDGAAVTIQGSFIVPAKTNKMFATTTLKAAAAKGHQQPAKFLGGSTIDTLEELTGGGRVEQAGLTMTTTLTDEERVEVNTLF